MSHMTSEDRRYISTNYYRAERTKVNNRDVLNIYRKFTRPSDNKETWICIEQIHDSTAIKKHIEKISRKDGKNGSEHKYTFM